VRGPFRKNSSRPLRGGGEVNVEEVLEEIGRIASELGRDDVLAVGLFGSLARGDFDERSDIDIFVITKDELTIEEQDELYRIFSRLIPRFKRDITLLVYDLDGLKRVPTWQTLNMLRDARFAFDRGGIEELFKAILRRAEESGIVYDEEEGVFKLVDPSRGVFEFEG